MERKQVLIVSAVAAIVVLAAVAAVILASPGDDGMDIRLTYSNKIDYEAFMIATDRGYFEQEGVKVTPLVVTGGIESAEAMMTGAADLGAMGEGPAVTLMSRDPITKLLARYSGGEGQHRLVSNSSITSVEDLMGKKVAVQFGSTTHGALLRLLDAHGVDPSEVELVPLNPRDMPLAMQTRQVDAMMGSEPWPTNVEAQCGDAVHEVADSSGLGSNFPLVLMSTEKAVKERPEAVAAVVRAIERANAFINSNYTEAAEICAQYTGLSAAKQQKCMDTLFFELDLTAEDIANLNATARFLLDSKKISALPDIAAMTDTSFLERLKEGA